MYRNHWRLLLAAGLLVFIPASVLESLAELASEKQIRGLPLDGVLIALLIVGTNTLAYQAYKGVATHASLLWRGGRSHVSLGDVLRQLPYLQLVIADLVITVSTSVGLLLLVIPGIAISTLLSLAPVIIELDKCSARAGLLRSYALVKRSFWLALVVQAVMLVLIYAIETVLKALGGVVLPDMSTLADALLIGSVSALAASLAVKPLSALAVVELTHELLAQEGRHELDPSETAKA